MQNFTQCIEVYCIALDELRDPKEVLGASDAQGDGDEVFRTQKPRRHGAASIGNADFGLIRLGQGFGVEIIGDRKKLHRPAFYQDSFIAELVVAQLLQVRKDRRQRDQAGLRPFQIPLEGYQQVQVFGQRRLDIV